MYTLLFLGFILFVIAIIYFMWLVVCFVLERNEKVNDVSNKVLTSIERLDRNLVNPISRGQFGEKIAEDVLNYLNLKEGIHYNKQKSTEYNRPDFTFKLSSGCVLNMDSKFPLNNYLKYCESEVEGERKQYLATFLKDVRERIKEAINYINPAESTLDFVLVFIPSDTILQFILEHDKGLMDFCLSNRVVLCSPWTLYSVLSIVLSVESFLKMDKEIIKRTEQIRLFISEWQIYKDTMDKMRKGLDKVNETLGALDNVRKTKMDRCLGGF